MRVEKKKKKEGRKTFYTVLQNKRSFLTFCVFWSSKNKPISIKHKLLFLEHDKTVTTVNNSVDQSAVDRR